MRSYEWPFFEAAKECCVELHYGTVSLYLDHFRYIKIHIWLRGLREWNKRNVLFIAEPQDDFFWFIPPSLVAKYEY